MAELSFLDEFKLGTIETQFQKRTVFSCTPVVKRMHMVIRSLVVLHVTQPFVCLANTPIHKVTTICKSVNVVYDHNLFKK